MSEKMTVTSDETGEVVEVVPVQATVVSANVSELSSEFTRADAKFMEVIMTSAVQRCYEEGKTDPEYIREKIQEARVAAKKHLRMLREAEAQK